MSKAFKITVRVVGAQLTAPPHPLPMPPKRTDFPLAA